MYKQIPVKEDVKQPTIDVPQRPHYGRVGSIVASYMALSIAMVMLNKSILNSFSQTPLTFLVGQLVVASIVLRGSFFALSKSASYTALDIKSLAPLIGINVVGLTMNTLCLKYVEAMMYQVARSLVLPLTLLLSVAANKFYISSNSMQITTVSPFSLLSCAIILVGFGVGMIGGKIGHVSMIGVMFSIASSSTTALHSIIIKLAMESSKKFDSWELVYVNNLFSSIALLPIALLIEWRHIMAMSWLTTINLCAATTIAGLLGLLINYTSFLQIHVTSPLTHTVSSAARGVLQSLVANVTLGERVTFEKAMSIAITLFGSVLYSLAKMFNV